MSLLAWKSGKRFLRISLDMKIFVSFSNFSGHWNFAERTRGKLVGKRISSNKKFALSGRVGFKRLLHIKGDQNLGCIDSCKELNEIFKIEDSQVYHINYFTTGITEDLNAGVIKDMK
ncbi:hypothetical protein RhiirA1_461758 [Rhizophagus irregularis]|uniref:Uncharacterized protein n=1 Tax=Rhizophagus irregularis TaxID=588596 RepID=A0A2I1FIQ6_9GLOM|nr:hypothetical protein RhiirA1_461758 [Rhizophagus irregularis]PKY34265.1 hypothetical protein RhiirB3_453824 [Rhizophagus irregularis]